MRTRLQDLLATADRQLASRSYDAAIDTYRTALGEPGAAETRVEELLEAACGMRDAARGIVRSVEIHAPPPEEPAAEEPAREPELAPPQIDREPESAPPPVVEATPIEPPTFQLLENDEWAAESPSQTDYRLEVERVSILDPTPLPEEPGDLLLPRVVVAAVIFIAVCAAALLLK